jgi:hypothetical protein
VTRLLVVAILVVGLLLAHRLYTAWRRRLASDPGPLPSLPPALVEEAERTWVVFTTPYCASCGPVTERLRSFDPLARVVTVDVTADPVLAGAFSVRTAPTVLLADGEGKVHRRLVGAAAVYDLVDAGAPAHLP